MAEFASRGVANTGLGFGIAGTALGLLDGLSGLMTNHRYAKKLRELATSKGGHCSLCDFMI